ncbi:Zn-dependent hydrolase [Sphingomonas sp. ID1715]|uniref:MBL fold metallo-hydrolase n=1 Tax=Sphingomonas sp. ID1715 TaxID=1656898 RepID=UPI0014886A0B|nr:MBL fold metallo-hydrolase [Sphingomonas sp. ID1715]NNM77323.1 Zn-dependent hydrolase [Sphingomonas sp. ID1715]
MARAIGRVLLFLIVALLLAIVLVPPFLDRVYYRGPVSAHFDGERFFNPDGEDTAAPPTGGSRLGFFARFLTGSDGRPPWPESVPVTPTRPPARVEGERMLVTWIGHATVLVQTAGLNILTDPIWSETSGPFGFGPRRVAEPGVRFEDLPKIDLVLVSHNHYDHMDLTTLKRLWERDKPVIVTSLGNDALIRAVGIPDRNRVTDCPDCRGVDAWDWGGGASPIYGPNFEQATRQGKLLNGAMVYVTRNHHWGSRWFADRNRALWSSFTVKLPGGNIFFAGDTGIGDGKWPAEAAALGPIRLALIPIGAFRFVPGQMGTGSHIGPIDAVKVFDGLNAARAIPIHWGTFRLSYEAYHTPPRLLAEAMRCAGHDPRLFAPVGIGQTVEVPPLSPQPPATSLGLSCLDSPAVRNLK